MMCIHPRYTRYIYSYVILDNIVHNKLYLTTIKLIKIIIYHIVYTISSISFHIKHNKIHTYFQEYNDT